MTTLSYAPKRSSFQSHLLQFLVHHNPFYLLSAVCMMLGCYALNVALELHAGQVGRLLILIATLNGYELLLLLLATYLIRRRGMLRDGCSLLLLELVFLADLTFLNAELATSSLYAGSAINAILFLLAVGKVAAALRVIVGRFPTRLFAYMVLQLGALFAMPCLLKWVQHNGAVSAQQFYLVWWLVGMLPAAYGLQRRLWRQEHLGDVAGQRVDVVSMYAVLPFVSLMAHVGMMHWVYRTPFCGADVSPVLIGLAVLLGSAIPTRLVKQGEIKLLRLVLPAVAVALAFNYPAALEVDLRDVRGHGAVLTPVMWTIGCAYLAYVYLLFVRYAVWCIAGGAVAAAVVVLGPTADECSAFLGLALSRSWQWLGRLIPRTAVQWGVTAVAAAFAFLGIGALLSLSRKEPAEEPTASAAQPET